MGSKRSEATIEAYGDLTTERKTYRPLERVLVRIRGRAKGDTTCRIRVCDSTLRLYWEQEVTLIENRGEASFLAAGALGVHWIYLHFPDKEGHSRYANFVVDCETGIESGNTAYDRLYPLTKEALLLSRREFTIRRESEDANAEKSPPARFVGYISGDTWRIDGVWLRDWIYQLPAYRYWEREMQCGLDRFLEMQAPDGSIPDGIRRDGSTWRMAVESDVEYILVLGVYQTWLVTGDDEWMARALPKLEKALAYVRNDERRWDSEHNLVKRGHTCDTWDFEIQESSDFVGKRFVVANCDQSGYYLAYRAMAEMLRHAGRLKEAASYAEEAEAYRQRANALLWDGQKYLHHVHLTPIEHPGFDESQQLSMGNVWAVTRGLADHQQAVKIIGEYQRRHHLTGDAYPWWSLQPGYPDELGYYPGAYCQQGGYANGGLMPWVGGELCRGCFEHGLEEYGLALYQQYIEHLERTGGRVHVWYWPDGEAGFRTTNEVPHTGWGMAQWLQALLEGLAGLQDTEGRMHKMRVSPRWAVTAEKRVRCAVRYACNDAYFAYDIAYEEKERKIRLLYTGSGMRAEFNVLLPKGWMAYRVTVDGQESPFKLAHVEKSTYVCFSAFITGCREVLIQA